ncbi:putative E3 ubiquitin-protein ligase XBAT35 isoform X2 [Silene latifolia]|uniref:putative E3 ubiquitin-protein ligase XBAT35 isoform X2 n=1 Tax=Silene latifolia TaxID=37657 RepID=UPI003D76B926
MTPVIIQPQCVDREGKTPLMAACLNPALHHVVKLLIELGANVKGFTNIVRAIENHICLYAGWLRKPMMPGFLELLAPQFLSRKVWAVVLPSGSRNLRKPFKLELAIYTSILDAQPHSKIALWKADMEEPTFNLHNPAVLLCGILTITFIENYDTRSTQVAKFQIVLKLPVLPNYAAVFRSPLILLVDCQG